MEFNNEDEEENIVELLERLKNNSRRYASFLDKYSSTVGLNKFSFVIGFGKTVDEDDEESISLDIESNTFTVFLSSDFELFGESEKILGLVGFLVDARFLLYEERKRRIVELEENDLKRDFNSLVLKSNVFFIDEEQKSKGG